MGLEHISSTKKSTIHRKLHCLSSFEILSMSLFITFWKFEHVSYQLELWATFRAFFDRCQELSRRTKNKAFD